MLLFACLWSHASVLEPSIGVVFPDEVAGLTLAGREVFPQKELGVNIGYKQQHMRASVFIYNPGLVSIPDGAKNDTVHQHFEQVIGEVQYLVTMGKLRAIKFHDNGPQQTSFTGCGPQLVWRVFEMDYSEDLQLESYTYLTAVRNHFVKLRISYKKGSAYQKQDVDRFVTEVRKLIGRCE
jgi:hypothetical protein